MHTRPVACHLPAPAQASRVKGSVLSHPRLKVTWAASIRAGTGTAGKRAPVLLLAGTSKESLVIIG